MKYQQRSSNGFTLIELLIVVAIIGILAAIAIPNFLAAQTRAKVSKVQAELRIIAMGLEEYHVDNSEYPLTAETPALYPTSPFNRIGGGYYAYAGRLSTPIAYISSAPVDLFMNHRPKPDNSIGWEYYEYWSEPSCGFDMIDITRGGNNSIKYVLWSWGPDQDADGFYAQDPRSVYDPTNGTISDGNIYRFGP